VLIDSVLLYFLLSPINSPKVSLAFTPKEASQEIKSRDAQAPRPSKAATLARLYSFRTSSEDEVSGFKRAIR
jgi:hypothetical protein